MSRRGTCTVTLMAVALALCVRAVPAGAQEEDPAASLTVAVLDFETKDRAVVDLGDKIADLLTVFLSMEEGLELVERAKLAEILKESELSVSGLVSPGDATRIGGLVGAQVLIMGRAFVVNEKLYITGKAISVETSRLDAKLAKGSLDEDLDVIVQELAETMATWLRENADKMVAKIETPADQVTALRKALAGAKLPVVSAYVQETHVGRATIDPAAETELSYLMRKVGVPVISSKELRIADWAMEHIQDAGAPLPSSALKADVLIVGQGFSEFAGRKGNLISVKARVELKAVRTRTGEVLAISRATTTVVDTAEQIAGKTALQKAAGQAALELLPEAIAEWNKLPRKDAEGAAPKEEG